MGLAAPRHVQSSWTRGRTHVPCVGKQTLIHCTTGEVQALLVLKMILHPWPLLTQQLFGDQILFYFPGPDGEVEMWFPVPLRLFNMLRGNLANVFRGCPVCL